MDLYNEKNEEIEISYLERIFHHKRPSKEVFTEIYSHDFIFKREDGLVVELYFLDYERDAYISVKKDDRLIAFTSYREADYIKILDEKNKIFEVISSKFFVESPSRTILSLTGSPVVQFSDDPESERRIMDVTPTELMELFDDFDEISNDYSNDKAFRFLCCRFSETAELTIYPGTGKLSLTIKSNEILLYSLNLINCDRVVTNTKDKKLFFTSGFNELEHLSYIECTLDLDDTPFLIVDPNSRPFLRGLG